MDIDTPSARVRIGHAIDDAFARHERCLPILPTPIKPPGLRQADIAATRQLADAIAARAAAHRSAVRL